MGLPSAIQNCVSSPPRRFHWRPPRAALEISLPSHLPKRDGVQFLCNRVSSLKTGVFIALLRAWIDVLMFFFFVLFSCISCFAVNQSRLGFCNSTSFSRRVGQEGDFSASGKI